MIRSTIGLIIGLSLLPSTAIAQTAASPAVDPHAGHKMPAAPDPHAGHTMTPVLPPAADPHAGHDMGAMKPGAPAAAADPHAGHNMAADAGEVIGNAPAPAPPTDHAADAVWGAAAVAPSRAALRREHGGFTGSMILFNLAEYQARAAGDGYRWEGEGWFGGDIDRFVVKTEGEADVRGPLEAFEVQALYSRAIDPWWNLQAGVRYDISPDPQRVYATLGFEGLAPYWFKAAGAVFLSNKGELRGRVEGFYDQRITQRLILQPRAEIEATAQTIREIGIGAGLTNIELGLRLRYEIAREFAPYIGVEWAGKTGETARFARSAGERTSGVSYVAGIRFWF
jgi:copper resistance protein B|nr:copper resistance protein B [uncultured Sandarakinorhabdus sp.]